MSAEYNLADIGKYGRLWLRYMEENEPSEYHHMARTGQLRKRAEAVNEEAYERLDNIEENWLKKHMTGKKKTFMKQFVIDGVNLLERFLESVGKVIGKIR